MNLLRYIAARRHLLLAWAMILVMSGGHVALLQLTAWSSMLIHRAPEMGWSLALDSTFDGSAPCTLCHAVDDLQQDQVAAPERERQEQSNPQTKPLLPEQLVLLPENRPEVVANMLTIAPLDGWADSLEPPPPRLSSLG